MKRTLRWLTMVVLLLAPGCALRGESVAGMPAPTGYVSDFAGVLTPETSRAWKSYAPQVDQQAHAQIAVVTVEVDGPDERHSADQMPRLRSRSLRPRWKKVEGGDEGDRPRRAGDCVAEPAGSTGSKLATGWRGSCRMGRWETSGGRCSRYLHSGDYNQAIALGVREISQVIATDAGVTLAGLEGIETPARAARLLAAAGAG